MEDRSAQVTHGWRFVHIGVENEPFQIDGVELWRRNWLLTREPHIVVAHPSYPHQRHRAFIWNIDVDDGRRIRFAASELSNGVWSFYVPEQPSS